MIVTEKSLFEESVHKKQGNGKGLSSMVSKKRRRKLIWVIMWVV